MDFSKKYLLKYGWEEGQGLGKTKNGIKIAIKPKLKFDKAGMGYDPGIEFTDSWWIKMYNEALEDTNVKHEGKEENESKEDKPEKKRKSKKRKLEEVSFTDMFNACEGRTVHKGARHGLQLSGKLQRLEQQELKLLPRKEDKINSDIESNNLKYSECISEPIKKSKHKKKK